MTDKAIFRGTFAKFQQVSGRKVVQFIIEVPTEAANHALEALGGIPQPDKSVWVAVARLEETAASEAPSPSRGHTLAKQAAILCSDLRFRTFLMEAYPGMILDPTGEFDAADTIRGICEVESRVEFDSDAAAGERWNQLHGEYVAWLTL